VGSMWPFGRVAIVLGVYSHATRFPVGVERRPDFRFSRFSHRSPALSRHFDGQEIDARYPLYPPAPTTGGASSAVAWIVGAGEVGVLREPLCVSLLPLSFSEEEEGQCDARDQCFGGCQRCEHGMCAASPLARDASRPLHVDGVVAFLEGVDEGS